MPGFQTPQFKKLAAFTKAAKKIVDLSSKAPLFPATNTPKAPTVSTSVSAPTLGNVNLAKGVKSALGGTNTKAAPIVSTSAPAPTFGKFDFKGVKSVLGGASGTQAALATSKPAPAPTFGNFDFAQGVKSALGGASSTETAPTTSTSAPAATFGNFNFSQGLKGVLGGVSSTKAAPTTSTSAPAATFGNFNFSQGLKGVLGGNSSTKTAPTTSTPAPAATFGNFNFAQGFKGVLGGVHSSSTPASQTFNTPESTTPTHFNFATGTPCPVPVNTPSPYANSAVPVNPAPPQSKSIPTSLQTPSPISSLQNRITDLRSQLEQPWPQLVEEEPIVEEKPVTLDKASIVSNPELWPEDASFTDMAGFDSDWAFLSLCFSYLGPLSSSESDDAIIVEQPRESPAPVVEDSKDEEWKPILAGTYIEPRQEPPKPAHPLAHLACYHPRDPTPWWSDPPPADWKEKVTEIWASTMIHCANSPEIIEMDTRVYQRRLRDIPYYLRSLSPPKPGYYGLNHAMDPKIEKEVERELKAEAKEKRREERHQRHEAKREAKRRQHEEERKRKEEMERKEEEERKQKAVWLECGIEELAVVKEEEPPVSVSGVCIMIIHPRFWIASLPHRRRFHLPLLHTLVDDVELGSDPPAAMDSTPSLAWPWTDQTRTLSLPILLVSRLASPIPIVDASPILFSTPSSTMFCFGIDPPAATGSTPSLARQWTNRNAQPAGRRTTTWIRLGHSHRKRGTPRPICGRSASSSLSIWCGAGLSTLKMLGEPTSSQDNTAVLSWEEV
ncbi:hypothetical protein DXG01_002096 [Tephrocybe rancida]|nr:hypothetical protein DXG01_002096 [Tephrocybe rancida]